MSATLATVAELAADGKNIVITTLPGIGTVTKTLFTLEHAGLSIGLVNISNFGIENLGFPSLENGELRMNIPEELLEAEVVVFDGGRDMTPYTFKIVTEAMTARTLHGDALPKVKSVVVLFTDDQRGTAPKLSALDNTVTINVR